MGNKPTKVDSYESEYTTDVKVQKPLDKLGTANMAIEVCRPWGVAISSSGNIIVAECGTNCISIFNPWPSKNGKKIKSFGSYGSSPGQFSDPQGVAVDNEDNILVVDRWNKRIQKFTSDGNFIMAADNLGLKCPTGIAIDPRTKRLYVADTDNHRLMILNPDLTLFDTFGSEGSGNGQFKDPCDVAFDSTGKAYVADRYNHCIQVFTAEGRYLRKFGREGSGDGELSNPIGISTDNEDVVYVTEWGNHRVSLFKCDSVYVKSFGSRGSGLGQFHEPHGIALDKDENIYVADYFNNRIQIFCVTC